MSAAYTIQGPSLSLRHAVQVEIMMSLEEKFDLELEEEGAEKIATVKEAAEMIAKQVAEKAK